MNFWVSLIIIAVVIIATIAVLYFVGTRAQKKRDQQKAEMEAAKQTTTMLIIDKKRMPMNKSGLPQMVIDNTPWYLRRSKLPVVKAKIGPKIFTLVCDEAIFDLIPLKKEVKAEVSGMYIIRVKGLRGALDTPTGKPSLGQRLRRWTMKTIDGK
ncbi:MAG: hypothetical protein ACOYBL_05490 [Lachnospiraceae bacterium]|jgi:hypothetical protein